MINIHAYTDALAIFFASGKMSKLGLGDPNIDEAPFLSCSSSLGSSWAQSVIDVTNIATFSTLEMVIIQKKDVLNNLR